MSDSWRTLVDALLERNLIKRRAMENALRRHRPTTETVEKVLLDAKLITRAKLVAVKGELHGMETVDLEAVGVDVDAARLLPQSMAERYSIVCYKRQGDTLLVAAAAPLDAIALDYLRMRSGFHVALHIAYAGDVAEASRKAYAGMPAMPPRPMPSVPAVIAARRPQVAALNRINVINEVVTSSSEPRRRVAVPGLSRTPPPAPPPTFSRPAAGLPVLPRLPVAETCPMCENTRLLVAPRDERDKIAAILQGVMEATVSEGASLLVLEDDGSSLFFKSVVGGGADALVDMVVPLDEASVAGWVLSNAECTIVHDAAADPFHNKRTDRALNFSTRSLVAAPIIWGEQRLGVLEAVNRRRGRYLDDDLRHMQVAAAQISVILYEARLARMLRSSMMETVEVMVDLLDVHGSVSRAHSMDVAQLAVAIGREAGLDEHDLEHLSYAGQLHDLGKAHTQSSDERDHPGKGAEQLERYPMLKHLAPFVGFHHERWDGDGRYGLAGKQIPLGARILAVAEAWIEECPWDEDGPAMRRHEREFKLRFGSAFDPSLGDAFVRGLETTRGLRRREG